MKRYVTEKYVKNHDGDLLVTIEVTDSKPVDFTYLVFLKK